MTVWMIWVRAGDDYTWLAAAWDEDSRAENQAGWDEALLKAKEDAAANQGEYRIQRVHVPGVFELFDIPRAEAVPE